MIATPEPIGVAWLLDRIQAELADSIAQGIIPLAPGFSVDDVTYAVSDHMTVIAHVLCDELGARTRVIGIDPAEPGGPSLRVV